MKRNWYVITAVLILLAFVAHAVSHSFSGTIDTPPVTVWVDGSSNTIAPYATLGTTGPLYIDGTTGYVWTLQNTLSSTPTAVGLPQLDSSAALYHTSGDCSGTPYLFLPSPLEIPKAVRTAGDTGNYYVETGTAAVTTHSFYLNGTCYSDTETANLYTTTGPLTAPTLASGPWHLENR